MSPTNLNDLFLYGRKKLCSRGIDSYALDAEVLLRHATGLDRAKLLTSQQMILDDYVIKLYKKYIRLREELMPVAYIINNIEFMSLPMYIDQRALIPRPDTETLVERALLHIESLGKIKGRQKISILELCTGSGCIALALLHYAPGIHVTATDCCADALQVANENIRRHNLEANIKFLRGDLYQPVAGLKFDLVIANPPYIPTGDIETLDADVRLYEPISALEGGTDGLMFYRRLCDGAQAALCPGGAVLFEIGFDQGAAVIQLLKDAGFITEIIKDLSGHDRVVMGGGV